MTTTRNCGCACADCRAHNCPSRSRADGKPFHLSPEERDEPALLIVRALAAYAREDYAEVNRIVTEARLDGEWLAEQSMRAHLDGRPKRTAAANVTDEDAYEAMKKDLARKPPRN